jgi:hypothetical protein
MSETLRHETFRSMISVSVEAFKALQYLNGGAMVAMVAYLTRAEKEPALLAHARCPMACFALGLFFGTACFATSYLTQFALFNESFEGRQGVGGVNHMVWVYITMAMGVGALLFFIGGVLSAVSALPAS